MSYGLDIQIEAVVALGKFRTRLVYGAIKRLFSIILRGRKSSSTRYLASGLEWQF